MSADFGLPDALLLLVHLHLLNYPRKDSSSYDEHLFDPSRASIRERTKIMEDVCYFLVGKLEGTRERMKFIFPTYPCLQPSDTVAFRVSLAKYIETLRSSVLHPKGTPTNSSRSRSKGEIVDATAETAWWWKDVIVRKSLLEKCCGERFEKLMLALSTHVLLNEVLKSESHGQLPSDRPEALHALPVEYSSLLAHTQAARAAWERSAAHLDQRKIDIAVLRARLADPESSPTKYSILTTDRLLALRRSRREDLGKQYWCFEEGRTALQFLVDLAGIETDPLQNSAPATSFQSSLDGGPSTASEMKILPSSPLPVMAAHHPALLHALGSPLLSTPKCTATDMVKATVRELNARGCTSMVAERIDTAARTQQALQDALTRSKAICADLKTGLAKVQATRGTASVDSSVQLQLWERPTCTQIDLRSTKSQLATDRERAEAVFDKRDISARVAVIRAELLPAYPPVPRSPSLPDPVHATSLIPQPSSKIPMNASTANAHLKNTRGRKFGMLDITKTVVSEGLRDTSMQTGAPASSRLHGTHVARSRRQLTNSETSRNRQKSQDGDAGSPDLVTTPHMQFGQATRGTRLSKLHRMPEPSPDVEYERPDLPQLPIPADIGTSGVKISHVG